MAHIDRALWEAASPLLDELLDLDTAAREERLDRLRRDDVALADTLDTLLAQLTSIDREDFLEGSAMPADAPARGQHPCAARASA